MSSAVDLPVPEAEGGGNVSTDTNFEGEGVLKASTVEGGEGVSQLLKATVEESEEEEEEGGEGVSQLLRATVEELESALNDTRQVLSARDEELRELRRQLERYKQQAAREIANKARLAQALDQSQNHVVQLEELLQSWQLKLQEFKVQGERFESALRTEQVKNKELEVRVAHTNQQKELESLRTELDNLQLQVKGKQPWQRQTSNPDSASVIDSAQQIFLKQAVYHLLTDFHAEEQIRAIVSILDFTAHERKAVYTKFQEKGGLYR